MNPDKLPPLTEFRHSVPLQIRFNDIDILGHLNNTVYFSFFDTGKAYFFESIRKGKIDWKKVDSVIANIDCAYVSPIFFGEKIEVRSRCSGVSDRSFRVQQVIVEMETGQLKAAAETVMVSFDPATQKSKDLPEDWRKALEESMGEKGS